MFSKYDEVQNMWFKWIWKQNTGRQSQDMMVQQQATGSKQEAVATTGHSRGCGGDGSDIPQALRDGRRAPRRGNRAVLPPLPLPQPETQTNKTWTQPCDPTIDILSHIDLSETLLFQYNISIIDTAKMLQRNIATS